MEESTRHLLYEYRAHCEKFEDGRISVRSLILAPPAEPAVGAQLHADVKFAAHRTHWTFRISIECVFLCFFSVAQLIAYHVADAVNNCQILDKNHHDKTTEQYKAMLRQARSRLQNARSAYEHSSAEYGNFASTFLAYASEQAISIGLC